jgi:peptidoglycan/LPS O-acetylase OafA/YrhL
LDWLRFGAAFAVLACHARGGHWVDWGSLVPSSKSLAVALFFVITRPNLEPVVVFFVLSGFLVGGKVVENLLNSAFNPGKYALDRVSRIYVPLFPALGLSALVAWITGHPIKLGELMGNIFSLQGIACKSFAGNEPLWSLSYEVWFYALAGAFAVVASTGAKHRVVAMYILAGGVIVYAHLHAVLLYCWLLGAAAYSLHRCVIPRVAVVGGLLLAITGAAVSQLNMQSRSLEIAISSLPSRDIAVIMMSAGFAVVVAWLASTPVRTAAALRFQSLGKTLASFSYTLYLTHYPILLFLAWLRPERHYDVTAVNLGTFAVKLAACLIVAWLLYLPFERRTDRFRAWLRACCS